MTQEVYPIEYDFSVLPSLVDVSTNSIELRQTREPNPESSLKDVQLYKLTSNQRDSWILLSGAYVEIRCKITNAGSASVAQGLKPTLSGDILDLFTQSHFYLDNQEISNVSRLGKLRTMDNVVKMSKGHAWSLGAQKGFFPRYINKASSGTTMSSYSNPKGQYGFVSAASIANTASAGAVTTALGEIDNPEARCYNLLWDGVEDATTTSNVVQFHVPLNEIVPFVDSFNKVVRGMEIRLELNQNTNTREYLCSPVDTTHESARVEITYLSLWLPHCKLTPKAELGINDFLVNQMNGKMRMRFADKNIFEQSFTFAQSTGNQEFRMVSNCSRPLSVVVGFQAEKRYSTTSGPTHGMRFDSSVFDHVSLDWIELRVNGYNIPHEAYALSSASLYLRALDSCQKLGGEHYGKDDFPIIDYKNWKSTYPLVCFDLSALDSSIFSDLNRADISVNFRIGSNSYSSQTNFTAVVLLTTEKEGTVDFFGDKKAMTISVK